MQFSVTKTEHITDKVTKDQRFTLILSMFALLSKTCWGPQWTPAASEG